MSQLSSMPSHDACFACGRLNDAGLGLIFEPIDDQIVCRTTLGPIYQSHDGIIHGGILAAIADAAMVHLVYQQHGGRPLTGSLEVRFRASVRVGDQITIEAAPAAVKHRVARASCRISIGDQLCVEATAAFKIG